LRVLVAPFAEGRVTLFRLDGRNPCLDVLRVGVANRQSRRRPVRNMVNGEAASSANCPVGRQGATGRDRSRVGVQQLVLESCQLLELELLPLQLVVLELVVEVGDSLLLIAEGLNAFFGEG